MQATKFKLVGGLTLATFVFATTHAFPPAPHHILFGIVRNQWGDPINAASAEVTLETASASTLKTSLFAAFEPGVNYRLTVPMDAGTALDLYKPSALRASMPFRLRVKIGTVNYLPIEMALSLPQMGDPARSTRLDLTLGEDFDGDGLPDAWEQALIAIYGGTLGTINPDDDADGDGISNRNEYLAGTYAFDPNDGFRLAVTGVTAGNSQLEFLAIRGRTYSLQTSTDLQQWSPVSFRVVTAGEPGAPQNQYLSTDVRLLKVEVPFQLGGETNKYFRAMVQ
jgi:hypothetical protein